MDGVAKYVLRSLHYDAYRGGSNDPDKYDDLFARIGFKGGWDSCIRESRCDKASRHPSIVKLRLRCRNKQKAL